jgi:hypothetical protein
VLGAILDDRQVLEIQETSGKVAFKSYDLHDVGSYLDEMSKKIREVIADNKYSNYVRPSFEIPNAGDNPVYGLHPDSSPSALNEYFRTYGVLKLSPKFPVETKSFSEKEEEHKKTLQEEVNKLTEQLKQKDIEFIERLKQKDDEISQSNQRFQKLEGLVKPILNEFSLTALENETPSYSLNQSQQPRYQAYLKPTPKTHSSTTGGHIPRNKWTTQTKVLSVVGIVVALLAILITYWLLSEDENPHVNDANPSSVTNQPKPTLTPREPLLIAVENGKQKGFLNEFAFLEQTDGTIVFNEADFKGVLTSYLFRSSPEIRAIYAGNRDELWRKIMELNPASKKKIADYIKEKVPFKIENSKDQQSLLKDLIIFIESPQ